MFSRIIDVITIIFGRNPVKGGRPAIDNIKSNNIKIVYKLVVCEDEICLMEYIFFIFRIIINIVEVIE